MACCHPTCSIKICSGVWASMPPSMAIVTKIPEISAKLRGWNHLDASLSELRKHKAAPMPSMNLSSEHCRMLVAKENPYVPATQMTMDMMMSFLTDNLSNNIPAGKRNKISA